MPGPLRARTENTALELPVTANTQESTPQATASAHQVGEDKLIENTPKDGAPAAQCADAGPPDTDWRLI